MQVDMLATKCILSTFLCIKIFASHIPKKCDTSFIEMQGKKLEDNLCIQSKIIALATHYVPCIDYL